MSKKPAPPHLPNLAISGFRGISNLTIPRLGRVTLLTGRNGVGKTTVLEAIRLYAGSASPSVLRSILGVREEIVSERNAEPESSSAIDWCSLFYGRPAEDASPKLSVGPRPADRQVRVRLGTSTDESLGRLRFFSDTRQETPPGSLFVRSQAKSEQEYPLALIGENGLGRLFARPDDKSFRIACASLGPGLIGNATLAGYWDRVVLNEQQDDVTDTLDMVLGDDCQRISVVGGVERRVVVKIASQPRPVPLKSLGDGATRLFGVVVALSSARGGLLLIDEVENGIHHRIQEDFWSLVLGAAGAHNVQVVATTHSWDCVRGFAQAAERRPDEAAIVRLQRKDGMVEPVPYSPSEIQVVARQGIEVR